MRVLVMSFDGDTQLERPEFKTIEEAWYYANDLGSKWYFYPFVFIVTNSGKTIKDATCPLEFLINCKIKTVERRFSEIALTEEAVCLEPEEYAFHVAENY